MCGQEFDLLPTSLVTDYSSLNLFCLVLRDPRDSRRLYLPYATIDDSKPRDFPSGSIHIKYEDNDFIRTIDGIVGYTFRLQLRQNKTLTITLTYNGLTIHIRRNDDRAMYCNREKIHVKNNNSSNTTSTLMIWRRVSR